MLWNYSSLREKDVINVCDGHRIGFICDFSIDAECGRICAIYVSDHFFGFTGQKDVIKIGWECITCIGEDAVLVRIEEYDRCRESRCDKSGGKKKKNGWFL